MRPFAYGKAFNGIATATGAFTITDLDGAAIVVGANERVIIYEVVANLAGTVAVGYDTTPLTGVGNHQWGVALPRGEAPTCTSLTTTTAVYIHGEIIAV